MWIAVWPHSARAAPRKGFPLRVQSWVDSEMSEAERFEAGTLPPDCEAWGRLMLEVRLFDTLIYNVDRHQ